MCDGLGVVGWVLEVGVCCCGCGCASESAGSWQRIAGGEGGGVEAAYQKWTVLGPMGLFQNFWKPAGSAPAVEAWRRAFARWKKGRKELKMREPGRNDMMASCVLDSRGRRFEWEQELGRRERGRGLGECRVREPSRCRAQA